jgi:hypothetical protein
MPVPAIDGVTGAVPAGRYPCALAEVEAAFGTSSPGRQALWSEFLLATELLRSVVPVFRAWIGGSFTTTEADPGDVDVTYVIRGASTPTLGPDGLRVLRLFDGAGLKAVGLRVDAYLLDWVAWNGPGGLRYHADRGYWDDWWQRQRGPGPLVTLGDAVPRRGYLEVELDDYVV